MCRMRAEEGVVRRICGRCVTWVHTESRHPGTHEQRTHSPQADGVGGQGVISAACGGVMDPNVAKEGGREESKRD